MELNKIVASGETRANCEVSPAQLTWWSRGRGTPLHCQTPQMSGSQVGVVDGTGTDVGGGSGGSGRVVFEGVGVGAGAYVLGGVPPPGGVTGSLVSSIRGAGFHPSDGASPVVSE